MAQAIHSAHFEEITLTDSGVRSVEPRVTGDLEAAPVQDVTDAGSNPSNRRALYQVRAEAGYEFQSVEMPSESDHPQVNPAYGRGSDKQTTVELAVRILGADCLTHAYYARHRIDRAATTDALQSIPYSAEELVDAKGRYVLVAVPRMTAREALEHAARMGLHVTVSLGVNARVLDRLMIPAGWYLVKKTDAPLDREDDLKMPRACGAFVMLYAAAVTRSWESDDAPLNGSSSETTWSTQRDIPESLSWGFRACALVNRVGSAHLLVQMDYRGRAMC